MSVAALLYVKMKSNIIYSYVVMSIIYSYVVMSSLTCLLYIVIKMPTFKMLVVLFSNPDFIIVHNTATQY